MFGASLLLVTFVPCVLAQDYRFFYNFASGTGFFETGINRQMSAGRLIAEFREVVQFQVSQEPDAASATLSARIISLSNKGRAIDYYDGVRFQALISATGEISDYAFSGGKPQHRALIQAAGPAKARDIFWMPAFPMTPLGVGDSFSHAVSTGGASARRVYELEEVHGHLARFRVGQSASVSPPGASGTESGEGRAVFDMEKGMWVSLSLRTEGTVTLPGGLTSSYKSTRSKEIARNGGCDRPTTGVGNARAIIDRARRIVDDLLRNTFTGWPGSGQDLYAVYRHFHCPNPMQLSRIGEHLRHAREILAEPRFICVPASADPCRRGRYGDTVPVSDSGPGTSRWRLVQICPSFFQLAEHEQAGVLIGSAVKASGVSERHLCRLPDSCYYNFLEPAEDVLSGNPFAYSYLTRELSGWTPPVQPDHVPCLPSLTDDAIRVRGGDAATDPASVQPGEGEVYTVLEDLVTGERFIRHNQLEGAEHYLYQELRDGSQMRYYLPPGY